MIRTGAALLAVLFLGYVIPGERVVRELARARGGAAPLRVEAELQLADDDSPSRIVLELHPEGGARVEDGQGGRWLLQGGRVVSRDGSAPVWIPPVDVLVLAGEPALLGWVRDAGIDLSVSGLARCGDADCFVLGRRESEEQLWVDQTRFEVRRTLLRGRRADFEAWRDFGAARFPERIRIGDAEGPRASLRVLSVERAKGLGPADFSPAWLR